MTEIQKLGTSIFIIIFILGTIILFPDSKKEKTEVIFNPKEIEFYKHNNLCFGVYTYKVQSYLYIQKHFNIFQVECKNVQIFK